MRIHNELPDKETLTSEKRLAKNTLWNIAGRTLSLIVSVVAIPFLIRGLGVERFGVLTLIWVVVGYCSLFDLGLGRALTMLVAEKLGSKRIEEIPVVVWTALTLMTIFAVFAALVVIILSPWLINTFLKIPQQLRQETLASFRWLAFSIPLVITTTALRGFIEAWQRFDLINLIRLPMSMITILGPLAVVPFSASLVPITIVLLVGRALAWIIHCFICLKLFPLLRSRISLDRELARQLFSFGGWMTISNLIAPLMIYLDRFIIGGLVSLASVAYYVTPYEIATKVFIIPMAMVTVLFPAFSATILLDNGKASRLFLRSINCNLFALFPIIFLLIVFSEDILRIWVGREFATNSATVLQLLGLGVFINSFSTFSFALVQGGGRPDLTAKLCLAELPFYLICVWYLTKHWGIQGSAAAWLLRATADMLILLLMSRWFVPIKAEDMRRILVSMGIAMVTFTLSMVMHDMLFKVILTFVVLPFFALSSWFFMLTQEDRLFFLRRKRINADA